METPSPPDGLYAARQSIAPAPVVVTVVFSARNKLPVNLHSVFSHNDFATVGHCCLLVRGRLNSAKIASVFCCIAFKMARMSGFWAFLILPAGFRHPASVLCFGKRSNLVQGVVNDVFVRARLF